MLDGLPDAHPTHSANSPQQDWERKQDGKLMGQGMEVTTHLQ